MYRLIAIARNTIAPAVLALSVILTAASFALAQEAPPTEQKILTGKESAAVPDRRANQLARQSAITRRAERALASITEELEKNREQLSAPDVSNQVLNKERAELEELRQQALTEQSQLRAPIDATKARLKKLGKAPENGKREEQTVTEERERLTKLLVSLEGVYKRLDLISLEIQQLSDLAADRERDNFILKIFETQRSIVNPLLWVDGLTVTPMFFTRLGTLMNRWWTGDGAQAGPHPGFLAVFAVFALGGLAICALWTRWGRAKWVEKGATDDLKRLARAFRVPTIAALILLAMVGLLEAALVTFGPEIQRVERLVETLVSSLVLTALTIGLARGVLRPVQPELRLVDLNNASAMETYRFVSLTAILYGIDEFVSGLGDLMFLPLQFTIAWSALASIALLLGAACVVVVIKRGSPQNGETEAESEADRRYYFGWVRFLFHAIWLIIVVTALSLLLGYIALSHYLISNLILTAASVAGLYLIHHLADAIVRSAIQSNTFTGTFLRRTLSFSENAISRLGILFSTLVDLAIVLIGVPLILSEWAVTWIDFRSWLTTAFFGFKVGDITIEPSSILLALMVLTFGLVIARLFTRWLDTRVLARSSVDSGVRNSIKTGAGYTGIILAAGLALTSAGVDFSNVAIMAGALGVGIGFGLQSIVNNFVSGLILLAERPIKVGDWIKVSGGEGIVKQINVRATEIETFDRCSVIIPNSSLISEAVGNWYHNDLMGRVKVPVGVSYDADPDEVRDILLQCGKAHPRAMVQPEPFVLFMGFGDSSLDFELRVYIDDVGWVAFVGSDLRFTIFKALKEAGIEIPFPQRDLHLRSVSDSVNVQALTHETAKGGA